MKMSMNTAKWIVLVVFGMWAVFWLFWKAFSAFAATEDSCSDPGSGVGGSKSLTGTGHGAVWYGQTFRTGAEFPSGYNLESIEVNYYKTGAGDDGNVSLVLIQVAANGIPIGSPIASITRATVDATFPTADVQSTFTCAAAASANYKWTFAEPVRLVGGTNYGFYFQRGATVAVKTVFVIGGGNVYGNGGYVERLAADANWDKRWGGAGSNSPYDAYFKLWRADSDAFTPVPGPSATPTATAYPVPQGACNALAYWDDFVATDDRTGLISPSGSEHQLNMQTFPLRTQSEIRYIYLWMTMNAIEDDDLMLRLAIHSMDADGEPIFPPHGYAWMPLLGDHEDATLPTFGTFPGTGASPNHCVGDEMLDDTNGKAWRVFDFSRGGTVPFPVLPAGQYMMTFDSFYETGHSGASGGISGSVTITKQYSGGVAQKRINGNWSGPGGGLLYDWYFGVFGRAKPSANDLIGDLPGDYGKLFMVGGLAIGAFVLLKKKAPVSVLAGLALVGVTGMVGNGWLAGGLLVTGIIVGGLLLVFKSRGGSTDE